MNAYKIYSKLQADFGDVAEKRERLIKGLIATMMLSGIECGQTYEICFDLINNHVVEDNTKEVYCYACHFKHKPNHTSCIYSMSMIDRS